MSPDPENMIKKIHERYRDIVDPSGRRVRVIEDVHSIGIAGECFCTVRDVYTASLRLGIIPFRYIRNAKSITIEEQLKLAESRVAVAGAGGLGGQALLLLARLGIGYLAIADHGFFDETNLNRQAFCCSGSIQRPKAEAAAASLKAVNPGVETVSCQVRINESNAAGFLEGSDVVVDGLDSTEDRFVLEAAAKKLSIPLVHAAIAGFEGHVMTVYPGDAGLEAVYGGRDRDRERSAAPEAIMGIPALTPALVASLQVMEVLKIILNRGSVRRNRMLYIDIETGRTNEFILDEPGEQV